MDCKSKCVSAGMSLWREYDSFSALGKTAIIFPENLRGLVREEDLKVQHSELGMHTKAAGKNVLAFFLTRNMAFTVFDDGEGCCGYVYGGDVEVLSPQLISKTRELFGGHMTLARGV